MGGVEGVVGVVGMSGESALIETFVAIAGLAATGVDCSRRLFGGGFLGACAAPVRLVFS